MEVREGSKLEHFLRDGVKGFSISEDSFKKEGDDDLGFAYKTRLESFSKLAEEKGFIKSWGFTWVKPPKFG